jgi:hypothetical protein
LNTKVIPQLGPATALVQLLTEHPELQRLRWSISPDGHLSGSAMTMAEDPRPAMAAYAAALGGKHMEFWPTDASVQQMFSIWLHVAWRDVELSLWMGCPVALALREVAQVAA